MGITASNYILRNYINVSNPNISVNLNEITEEELNNIVSTYRTRANDYANAFVNAFITRDYVIDMLEKDICIESGLSTVNKITNQYIANIKADNYFNQVRGNNKIFENENTINNIYNDLISLKNNLFNDENQSGIYYGGEGWSTDKTLPPVVYDKQSISIDKIELEIEQQGNIIFIKDIANRNGNERTFTAYQENPEYDSINNTQVPIYIPKYTLSRINDLWSIKNTENIVLKTSENIDADSITWSEPISE